MNAKKVRTSAAALALASAIALSGTFAWQSISQRALNEAKGTYSNPGGRLHDDFGGPGVTKDIYVENFGEQPIYARVRLAEYMEIGTGAGNKTGNNTANPLVAGTNINSPEGWTIHIPGATSGTIHEGAENTGFTDPNKTFHTYWTWTMGGQDAKNNPDGKTVYMPTFNMNKDSLKADINGTMQGKDGKPYGDYHKYTLDEKLIGDEVHDIDTNTTDEGGSSVEGTNHRTEKNQIHTAKETLTAKVMTMKEYTDLTAEQKKDLKAWVYDTDGWAYWSQPIAPKTATGLLLDKIELVREPQGDWYYGIHAVGQFVTADDLGRNNNTGFFDKAAGSAPSEAALGLLKGIGVNTDGGTNPGGTNPGGTNPGGTEGTNPGGTNPGGTNPGGTEGTNPGGTNPGGTEGTNPGGTNPGGTEGTNPGGTNPGGTEGTNPGGNASATYTATVTDPTGASVSGRSLEYTRGALVPFSANVSASDGSTPAGTWTWTSSAPDIADIVGTGNDIRVKFSPTAKLYRPVTITATNDLDPGLNVSFDVEAIVKEDRELIAGDHRTYNGIGLTVLAREKNKIIFITDDVIGNAQYARGYTKVNLGGRAYHMDAHEMAAGLSGRLSELNGSKQGRLLLSSEFDKYGKVIPPLNKSWWIYSGGTPSSSLTTTGGLTMVSDLPYGYSREKYSIWHVNYVDGNFERQSIYWGEYSNVRAVVELYL